MGREGQNDKDFQLSPRARRARGPAKEALPCAWPPRGYDVPRSLETPFDFLEVVDRASSCLARSSHLARISFISSSVSRSTPTKELWALLTRINSLSLIWIAAASLFCEF